ncbi:MAG: hypothetical protein CM15mP111_4940 [Hyphomicrobiales bacterium]|nr:MAG: hypothetical protein CM15mP111_4940 [Hyphomicrobiales bacterium]
MQKISRSGVEKYLGCPRCFVLQYKYKVSLSQILSHINSAVDELCKNEFDHYRQKGEPHPLFLEHNIDAIPFMHADIDKWRNFRQGLHTPQRLMVITFMAPSMMWSSQMDS